MKYQRARVGANSFYIKMCSRYYMCNDWIAFVGLSKSISFYLQQEIVFCIQCAFASADTAYSQQ